MPVQGGVLRAQQGTGGDGIDRECSLDRAPHAPLSGTEGTYPRSNELGVGLGISFTKMRFLVTYCAICGCHNSFSNDCKDEE